MTPKKKKNEVVLTVQCVGCGKKRDIKPGEIADNDFPMCDLCYLPMMPKQATLKK